MEIQHLFAHKHRRAQGTVEDIRGSYVRLFMPRQFVFSIENLWARTARKLLHCCVDCHDMSVKLLLLEECVAAYAAHKVLCRLQQVWIHSRQQLVHDWVSFAFWLQRRHIFSVKVHRCCQRRLLMLNRLLGLLVVEHDRWRRLNNRRRQALHHIVLEMRFLMLLKVIAS